MDFCNNLTVRTCVSVSWKEGLAIVNFAIKIVGSCILEYYEAIKHSLHDLFSTEGS